MTPDDPALERMCVPDGPDPGPRRMTAGQKIIEGLKEARAGNFARVHLFNDDGERQTWQRVDEDTVTIPRARLEAYEDAAARILRSYPGHTYSGHGECACVHCEGNKAAAALRAAGIHETEGGDS